MIKQIKQLWQSVFYDGYHPKLENGHPPSIDGDTPKYPPITKGIRVVDLVELIQSQQPFIDKIQQTGGVTKDEWDRLMLPLIRNLARYVHLLPASSNGEFKGPGGLFRMSLEIGAYSLQIANATIFSTKGVATSETRFKMHPKWVYATFVAGVCSMLYRISYQMVVTDEHGERWPIHLQNLFDWATEKKATRYFVVWNEIGIHDEYGMQQTASAFAMNIIIPKEGLQFINDDNSEILPAMTAAITGSTPIGTKNQIESIVKNVTKQLIHRDMRRNPEHYGNFTAGAHMEPVLLDGMRKLIKKGVWTINSKGARIWYSKEGMFIVWGLATKELVGILNQDNLTWVPTDPDTLADILIGAEIAESTVDDNRYWDICIPPGMQILQALKISRTEVFFNNPQDLSFYEGYLLPKNLQNAATPRPKPKATPVENKTEIAQSNIINADKPVQPISPQEKEEPQVTSDTLVTKAKIEQVENPKGPAVDTKPKKERKRKVEDELSSDADRNEQKQETLENLSNKIAEEDDSNEIPDHGKDLIRTLPVSVIDFVRAIIEDHRDNSSEGPVISVQDGMFISTKELESHGHANYTELLQVLETKNWLWSDPEKPLRKLFDLEHGGENIRGIILRKDIAKILGFRWKQPKKSNNRKESAKHDH